MSAAFNNLAINDLGGEFEAGYPLVMNLDYWQKFTNPLILHNDIMYSPPAEA